MPRGPGTYGNKPGRPPKKPKKGTVGYGKGVTGKGGKGAGKGGKGSKGSPARPPKGKMHYAEFVDYERPIAAKPTKPPKKKNIAAKKGTRGTPAEEAMRKQKRKLQGFYDKEDESLGMEKGAAKSRRAMKVRRDESDGTWGRRKIDYSNHQKG